MAQPIWETAVKEVNMLAIAQKMLEENNLCVLATCSNNLPNSSLMHYIYDGIGMNIIMLTLRGSTKHKNIKTNPQVSLLIDTRADLLQPGLPIMALTVYGKAGIIQDPQRHKVLVDQLVDRYNSLAKLAGDSRCLVIQVQMEKMLLLDGISDKSTIDI
jgi:nitroimidazol reductase NimA-like FMN-containing flavoprotein (pyridoxamine 5'-phosphate oxidase superfamily)